MISSYFIRQGENILFSDPGKFNQYEFDYPTGVFKTEDYEVGMRTLATKGFCEIKGEGCLVRILKENGIIKINFSQDSKSYLISEPEKILN